VVPVDPSAFVVSSQAILADFVENSSSYLTPNLGINSGNP